MRPVELLSQLRSLGVKVWADGDRLRYNAPKGALSPELLAQLAANKAEILSFLQKAATGRSTPPPIPVARREGPLPLSFAQQRLWFLDQLTPGLPGYNMPAAFQLSGRLDHVALQQSLSAIVERHEALRTTFARVDGEPVQVIAAPAPMPLAEVDLRALPPAEREAAARQEALAEAQRPFDMEHGPLMRATLVRLDETEYLALITLHHIIADGWSISVLIRELVAFYTAYTSGKPVELPKLPIQYADFAVWQREWLQGSVVEQQLAYWRRQLGDQSPALDLPFAHPRPPVQTFVGSFRSFVLDPGRNAALLALSQQEGATLFMTLLAAFQTLLYRYTGQTDIAVGSPIANRTRVELEPLIGFFVNTLVLRADLAGNPTMRELLGRVREITLEAYAHQDVPFERLVEALRPERDMSRTPLFQVMFVLQNNEAAQLELPGMTLRPLDSPTGTSKFDLLLSCGEIADGLLCEVEYNTDLFDTAAIDRLIGHFRTLLDAIIADPGRRIDDLPLLTAAEREQILDTWNATTRMEDGRSRMVFQEPGASDSPSSILHPLWDTCVHQMFEQQAERAPGAIAVEFPAVAGRAGMERLTYRELNARANQLAHRLRALGVGPDARVAISMNRSPELVIGILGILKAGGAYVPLDPAYPAERLAVMLEDSRAAVLLTNGEIRDWRLEINGSDQSLISNLQSPTIIDLADWDQFTREPTTNPASGAAPENLAYVIYTSGSTGRPKGVAMPHRALANMLAWQLASFTIAHPARTVQFSSPSFDVSFQEIFSTWCSGGTLVLIADDVRRDPAALLRFLENHAIERLFLPFVALQQIAEIIHEQGRPPASLREVITAGEQLRITQPIADWLGDHSGTKLHNHYGPSESHVVTAYTLQGPASTWPALPPIGRAIANTQIYLLDRRMQPVPIGVPGELYIGGANLARGYLDRPDMTAERFIPDPFATTDDRRPTTEADSPAHPLTRSPVHVSGRWSVVGGRLYKTGDLARYQEDGNIEFLGRADYQVKLRGYRIEPGEIEAILGQHSGVREACVAVRADASGERRLIAYFVPTTDDRQPTTDDRRPTTEDRGLKIEDSSLGVHAGLSSILYPPSSSASVVSGRWSVVGELRSFLKERLPAHMIPAVFVPLEAWPLTPSGKIDRRALPAPDGARIERQDTYVAPRDTLELELAHIWEELLGGQPVGVHDSFFDLGGHSLLVVRLMSRIQKQLGQSLPLSALFREPTIEHLARTLRQQTGALPYSPLVGLRPGSARRPFFCVHPGAGNVLCYVELVHRLDAAQPFYGLQAAGLEGEQAPRTRVEDMAAAYIEALRAVQPEGPYLLGGWSFGGLVAFEMAQQLRAQGQEIALLALIDSWAPVPDDEPIGDGAAQLAWFALDLARRFGKEPEFSLDDLRQISPDRQLLFVLEQARAAGILPPDIGEEQIRPALDVFATNMRAMRDYRPHVYDGRVTLFRASEQPADEPADAVLGWSAFAAGGVEVQAIPGDHYAIVTPPNVEVLAERLGALLEIRD